MSGETDLQKLLQGMQPVLNEGEYVFCTVDTFQRAAALNPVCVFQEQEAITVSLYPNSKQTPPRSLTPLFAHGSR